MASILYFEEKKQQTEIAEILGISRSYVSQLLTFAKNSNLISFKVNTNEKESREYRKEVEFKKYFPNLDNVYILNSRNKYYTRKQIGEFASEHIEDLIEDANVIGIGLGNSVLKVVEGLSSFDHENKTIVQLIGGINGAKVNTEETYPIELIKKLSEKINSEYYHLIFPSYLENIDLRNLIMQEEKIQSILDLWKKVDLSISGIGTANRSSTHYKLVFSENALQIIDKSKASGEVNLNFVDLNGNRLSILKDNIININFDDYININKKVVVGYGEKKVRPILAALRAGLINVLITDLKTIEAIEQII